MDYGTILVSIIIAIYFIIKFSKDKKSFNLLIVFMAITGIFYRKAFGIYSNVGKTAQTTINIIYWISLLILLVIYFINEKKSKKAIQ